MGEHVNKLQARHERERREAELCDAVTAALPAFLDPVKVHPHAAYVDACVETRANDRAAGLRCFERMQAAGDVLPLAVVRSGCVGIKPVAAITEREHASAEIIDELWPLVWKLDALRMTYRVADEPFVSLRWFARVGPHRVEIRCGLLSDPARLEPAHERDGRGRILRHRWTLQDAPRGERINYASGDRKQPGERVVYFYCEPGNGPMPADYLGVRDADCGCWNDEGTIYRCERCKE